MKKLKAIAELVRAGNCLMAALATAIGYFLVTTDFSLAVGLAMAAAFFVCAGGQAINDVFDSRIDAKVSKKKPIPSGRISRRNAYWVALLLFSIGILISALINTTAFIIASLFALLLIFYASILYKAKYIGNFVVAAGTAFTFIFGAASSSVGITILVLVIAGGAFLANLAREIIKDFEDLKKDRGFKTTLPMKVPAFAKSLAVVYYILAIVIGAYAFMEFNLGLFYLGFLAIASLIFGTSMRALLSGKYGPGQKKSKMGMLVMLLAYIGAIFR